MQFFSLSFPMESFLVLRTNLHVVAVLIGTQFGRYTWPCIPWQACFKWCRIFLLKNIYIYIYLLKFMSCSFILHINYMCTCFAGGRGAEKECNRIYIADNSMSLSALSIVSYHLLLWKWKDISWHTGMSCLSFSPVLVEPASPTLALGSH